VAHAWGRAHAWVTCSNSERQHQSGICHGLPDMTHSDSNVTGAAKCPVQVKQTHGAEFLHTDLHQLKQIKLSVGLTHSP
jgi:capsid protein